VSGEVSAECEKGESAIKKKKEKIWESSGKAVRSFADVVQNRPVRKATCYSC